MSSVAMSAPKSAIKTVTDRIVPLDTFKKKMVVAAESFTVETRASDGAKIVIVKNVKFTDKIVVIEDKLPLSTTCIDKLKELNKVEFELQGIKYTPNKGLWLNFKSLPEGPCGYFGNFEFSNGKLAEIYGQKMADGSYKVDSGMEKDALVFVKK